MASSSHSHPFNQDQQHTRLHALETERKLRNIRRREKRQSMSSSERKESLARRRANYQLQRQMRNRGQSSTFADGVQQEDEDGHQTIPPHERESQREQWRTSKSIWRASMSFEQRTEYLARRQANYHDQRVRRARGRRPHNCARNFRETIGVAKYHLPAPTTCPHCHARLFYHETRDMCCLNGKTILPLAQSPPEIIELFTNETPQGTHFRQNIRAYNHVFSFTSMGVHVDQNLATGGATFTFRAQGSIYHRIGSLLPDGNNRPRFLQLYIYDTDHEVDNRMLENEALYRDVVENIQQILNRHNPFVQTFHHLAQCQDLQTCRLIIREQATNQHQYTLPSASQVAAIIVGADDGENTRGRDIVIQTKQGELINIQDCVGYYDPLQYPLLLPYGTYGWDVNSRNNNGKKLTCRDYYAYVLQIRQRDESVLLRGGRLLQQYVVDNYVKIETQKLRWIRSNQATIRRELYNGLQDSLNAGENNAGNIGQKTVLPSSFIGSPRDMHQRYQDAMALVQKFGRPDIFLTMTCNPNWEEIKTELLPGQVAQDRPDLATRIFRAKFEELKVDVIKKGVLGTVVAYVYVIEFQKRGLPHVHMLLMLSDDDKLNTPDDYDHIVRAEIPNQNEEP